MKYLTEEIKNRLFDLIEKEKPDMVDTLMGLLEIPSVSDDKAKVAEAMEYTLSQGKKQGFDTELRAGGQVGVIEMGQGDEMLGILTHIDVVPAEPLDQWNTDPFVPAIIDGNIYARGALDDKGMVISSLYAMKAVRDLGLPLRKKVQLIVGSQEEVKWTDMDAYVPNYKLPDYGFTPDGEFPILNIEKGVCDLKLEFELSEDDKAAGGLQVASITAGSANNVVPGSAEAILTDGTKITAVGKITHASMPENGVNALFELRKKLKNAGISENKFTNILDILYDSIGDYVGKTLPIYKESEYYRGEFVDRTRFAPTVFKTEGDKITVIIDIRNSMGTEEKEIIQCFEELFEPLGGRVFVEDSMPTTFVPSDSPFLGVYANAYEEVSGLKNSFKTAFGASYAKAMPNIVAWGPLFPGDVDTCHEPNEFIPLDTLMKCTGIYALAIAEIALQDMSFR